MTPTQKSDNQNPSSKSDHKNHEELVNPEQIIISKDPVSVTESTQEGGVKSDKKEIELKHPDEQTIKKEKINPSKSKLNKKVKSKKIRGLGKCALLVVMVGVVGTLLAAASTVIAPVVILVLTINTISLGIKDIYDDLKGGKKKEK